MPTTPKPSHTPTPWTWQDGKRINVGALNPWPWQTLCDEYGESIHGRSAAETMANAAFIVTAVNSHSSLLACREALERLLDVGTQTAESLRDAADYPEGHPVLWRNRVQDFNLVAQEAHAALEASKGSGCTCGIMEHVEGEVCEACARKAGI